MRQRENSVFMFRGGASLLFLLVVLCTMCGRILVSGSEASEPEIEMPAPLIHEDHPPESPTEAELLSRESYPYLYDHVKPVKSTAATLVPMVLVLTIFGTIGIVLYKYLIPRGKDVPDGGRHHELKSRGGMRTRSRGPAPGMARQPGMRQKQTKMVRGESGQTTVGMSSVPSTVSEEKIGGTQEGERLASMAHPPILSSTESETSIQPKPTHHVSLATKDVLGRFMENWKVVLKPETFWNAAIFMPALYCFLFWNIVGIGLEQLVLLFVTDCPNFWALLGAVTVVVFCLADTMLYKYTKGSISKILGTSLKKSHGKYFDTYGGTYAIIGGNIAMVGLLLARVFRYALPDVIVSGYYYLTIFAVDVLLVLLFVAITKSRLYESRFVKTWLMAGIVHGWVQLVTCAVEAYLIFHDISLMMIFNDAFGLNGKEETVPSGPSDHSSPESPESPRVEILDRFSEIVKVISESLMNIGNHLRKGVEDVVASRNVFSYVFVASGFLALILPYLVKNGPPLVARVIYFIIALAASYLVKAWNPPLPGFGGTSQPDSSAASPPDDESKNKAETPESDAEKEEETPNAPEETS